MIQDKDFTLRLIRQLTQALEKHLLGKPEESLMQKELDFGSLMKDMFKVDFAQLSSMKEKDIIQMVTERQERDRKDYYELLGNLFYFKFRETGDENFGRKAKTFYELYLKTSGVFAMPVISRLNLVKDF